MSLIDDKGRLFNKFNIIDTIIILMVIIMVAGGLFMKKYIIEPEETDVSQKIQYKFELQEKAQDYADKINIGDEIRDSIKGNYLGTIIKKELKPATKVTENVIEGKYIIANIPDKFDIILTLEAQGEVTATRVAAEGVEIKVGNNFFIKGKGYASQAYIVGIIF